MRAMDIGLGWSVERRREEIARVINALVSSHGLSRAEAVDLLARRMGAGFNTVEGWISGGGSATRSPPPWQVILLLQYELGLREVLDLAAWGQKRGARHDESGKVTPIRKAKRG
jgi:hypothetical protein